MTRAWWLLGCAAATFAAAELISTQLDDERRTWWDAAFTLVLSVTAVLAVAAIDVASRHA
jgi:hypothetical protein